MSSCLKDEQWLINVSLASPPFSRNVNKGRFPNCIRPEYISVLDGGGKMIALSYTRSSSDDFSFRIMIYQKKKTQVPDF